MQINIVDLPRLEKLGVGRKRVIVRMDLDVAEDYTRIETAQKTLNYLIENKAKTIIIGHKGRPGGVVAEELSLRPLAGVISKIVGRDVKFIKDIVGEDAKKASQALCEGEVVLLENLRFDAREEENDEDFAKQLASLGEVYVNEAFAVSHRAHASIVGIPKYLPHAAGLRFAAEVDHLARVTENPERPLVFLISGIKKDKIEMIEKLTSVADKILVAGRLPEYLQSTNYQLPASKVVIAQLNPDKQDITINSIERFKAEIGMAKTIVLAGVVGKYEDEGQRQGTKMVFEAVANSSAYKVAGGGDTEAALTMFNLTDKFDWISVGGGACLEFLAKGTLPGIEVLLGKG